MKNLVMTIAAVMFATTATADLDRSKMDPACITHGIDYVQNPIVEKGMRDVIFAAYSPEVLERAYETQSDILQALVGSDDFLKFAKQISIKMSEKMQKQIDPLMDDLKYAMVSSMCNRYETYEMEYLNDLMRNPIYASIISKQADIQIDISLEMMDEMVKLNMDMMQEMMGVMFSNLDLEIFQEDGTTINIRK